MKKLLCLLCVFLLGCFALKAQETSKPYAWIIKLDTPQLFDSTSFPNVQLSLERKITPAFSIVAEGGLQLYNEPESKPDTLIYKAQGFKIKLEARCYLMRLIFPNSHKILHRGFVGIQPFYRQNRYTTGITFSDSTKVRDTVFPYESPYISDHFGVKNRSYGINLTLGFQKEFRRIVLEPSIAIGYMNRKITNIQRVYDPKIHQTDNIHDIFGFENRRLSENSGDFVNFSLHFRIGYKFNL